MKQPKRDRFSIQAVSAAIRRDTDLRCRDLVNLRCSPTYSRGTSFISGPWNGSHNELACRMFIASMSVVEATVEADPDTRYGKGESLVRRVGRTRHRHLEKCCNARPEHSLALNDMGFLFGRGEAKRPLSLRRPSRRTRTMVRPQNLPTYTCRSRGPSRTPCSSTKDPPEQPGSGTLRAIARSASVGANTQCMPSIPLIGSSTRRTSVCPILENLGALPDSVPPASHRGSTRDGLIVITPLSCRSSTQVYVCCPDGPCSDRQSQEQTLRNLEQIPRPGSFG
jgi:hypothetical protein